MAFCPQSDGTASLSQGIRIVSVSADRTAKVWSTEGALLQTLSSTHGSADSIWGLAVSSDSQQVVSASGNANQIILWKNLEQQLELRNTPQANLLSVAFVPDQPMSLSDTKSVFALRG